MMAACSLRAVPSPTFPLLLGEQRLACLVFSHLVKVTLNVFYDDLLEFACGYPEDVFILSPDIAAEAQKELYKGHLNLLDDILEYDE